MRSLAVRCVISFILVASSVIGQERPTAPLVPPTMLQGQRLVDKQSQFSIEAPAEWIWLLVPSENDAFRNYAASNPDGGLGYAVNVAETELPWTTQNANDFQIGMAKKLRGKGFTVEPRVFASTDFPVGDSYRFSWRVVLPSGAVMHRFGYALKHNGRVLSITCFASDEGEPAGFRSFVASLRLF
jgi:hypothetical protein